jgi:xanthine/CO dehydrogenase XdhC/CoxF family maturation factor
MHQGNPNLRQFVFDNTHCSGDIPHHNNVRAMVHKHARDAETERAALVVGAAAFLALSGGATRTFVMRR